MPAMCCDAARVRTTFASQIAKLLNFAGNFDSILRSRQHTATSPSCILSQSIRFDVATTSAWLHIISGAHTVHPVYPPSRVRLATAMTTSASEFPMLPRRQHHFILFARIALSRVKCMRPPFPPLSLTPLPLPLPLPRNPI